MTAGDARLDAIQARLDAATPGPWAVDAYQENVFQAVFLEDGTRRNLVARADPDDAVFIAAAPADMAFLLAELREAREALTRVEGLHRPERRWLPYRDADRSYDTAEEAAQDLGHTYTIDPANMPYFEVCAHCKTVEEGPCDGECTKELGYRESLWPCPTARAAVAAANGDGR